jgi:hypothetical protein
MDCPNWVIEIDPGTRIEELDRNTPDVAGLVERAISKRNESKFQPDSLGFTLRKKGAEVVDPSDITDPLDYNDHSMYQVRKDTSDEGIDLR